MEWKEANERLGAFVCGGEAVWSETEHGCNHMDLWVGKDIYPESEMSEMELHIPEHTHPLIPVELSLQEQQ